MNDKTMASETSRGRSEHSEAAHEMAAPRAAKAGATRPSQTHFLYLDFLRGIAALMVFIYHLRESVPGKNWISGSFLAVDLFFLMSGFVIAAAYEPKLRGYELSLSRFAKVRLLRLYPLYAVSVGLGLAYFTLKFLASPDKTWIVESVRTLPFSLAILPSPWPGQLVPGIFPFGGSAWSLSLEFWFNIVFAAVMVRRRTRTLSVIALVCAAALVVTAIIYHSVDMGWNWPTLIGGAARFWASFLFGVVLYRLRSRLQPPQLPKALQIVLLPVCLSFPFVEKSDVFVQCVYIFAVFPVSIMLLASCPAPEWTKPLFRPLGDLSYGLYILHAPLFLIIAATLKIAFKISILEFTTLHWAVIFASVIVGSALLTFAYDVPLRRRLSITLQGKA